MKQNTNALEDPKDLCCRAKIKFCRLQSEEYDDDSDFDDYQNFSHGHGDDDDDLIFPFDP